MRSLKPPPSHFCFRYLIAIFVLFCLSTTEVKAQDPALTISFDEQTVAAGDTLVYVDVYLSNPYDTIVSLTLFFQLSDPELAEFRTDMLDSSFGNGWNMTLFCGPITFYCYDSWDTLLSNNTILPIGSIAYPQSSQGLSIISFDTISSPMIGLRVSLGYPPCRKCWHPIAPQSGGLLLRLPLRINEVIPGELTETDFTISLFADGYQDLTVFNGSAGQPLFVTTDTSVTYTYLACDQTMLFNNDFASSIIGSNGIYTITGNSHAPDLDVPGVTSDILVAQINMDSDEMGVISPSVRSHERGSSWMRKLGGALADVGRALVGYGDLIYVTGDTYISGASNYDLFLMALNDTGDSLWTRTYGGSLGDFGRSIDLLDPDDPTKPILIAGVTRSFAAAYDDSWFLAYDMLSDDTILTQSWDWISNDDRGSMIVRTHDGGFIIVGESYAFHGSDLVVTARKFDSLYANEWTRTYTGGGEDRGVSIRQTYDHGYIITGLTQSIGYGNRDVYLLKIDSVGDVMWETAFGGAGEDVGHSVIETLDSGYVITGFTKSFGAGERDMFIIRADKNGDTLWTRILGGAGNDQGNSVLLDLIDTTYVIAGTIESSGTTGYDIWLVQIDDFGDTVKTITIDGGYCRNWYETTPELADSVIADTTYTSYFLGQDFVEFPGTIHVRYLNPGDANADGAINVGDAVFMINYVFKNGPPPEFDEEGDANCDYALNVGDAVFLINYVFKGGPAPGCP
ncbi:MAG: hypothetical protein GY841_13035 [FCB group bacterium]|nr:hypothetical protein [FCB group bacterium]